MKRACRSRPSFCSEHINGPLALPFVVNLKNQAKSQKGISFQQFHNQRLIYCALTRQRKWIAWRKRFVIWFSCSSSEKERSLVYPEASTAAWWLLFVFALWGRIACLLYSCQSRNQRLRV